MSLRRALEASRDCGVTRLADITGLDVLGLHVYQAVRPWGRGLSLHQGKGLVAEAAMVGALMEAIECDHAESFEGDQRRCAFEQLAVSERAPTVLDFARSRSRPLDPEEVLTWVPACGPDGRRTIWTPFDVVSLDFSRKGDLRLDRSSDGLGARFDYDGAALKALLEVVERDAEHAWLSKSVLARGADRIKTSTITCGWFEDFVARARSHGLTVSVFHLPAVIPMQVFMCEIFESAAGAAPRLRTAGSACGFSAEEALLAAVAEAAQTRLTVISGVRDDLPPPDPSPAGFGFAFPASRDCRLKTWEEVAGALQNAPPADLSGVAESLARAGYPHIGLVDLSRPTPDVRVVKAVVPGLGGGSRARRPPLGLHS